MSDMDGMLGFIENITISGEMTEAPAGALVVAKSYRSIKPGFERILKKIRSKPGLMLQYDAATTSAPDIDVWYLSPCALDSE